MLVEEKGAAGRSPADETYRAHSACISSLSTKADTSGVGAYVAPKLKTSSKRTQP